MAHVLDVNQTDKKRRTTWERHFHGDLAPSKHEGNARKTKGQQFVQWLSLLTYDDHLMDILPSCNCT